MISDFRMNRFNRNSSNGGSNPPKRGRQDDTGGRAKTGGGGGGKSSGGGSSSAAAPMRRVDIEEELNRQDPNQRPNNILMFTVLNATYPIDVATMHRVCSPHGQVIRIVMFRKDGQPPVNALVEFPDVDTAIQARWNLHGKRRRAGRPDKEQISYLSKESTCLDWFFACIPVPVLFILNSQNCLVFYLPLLIF